MRYFLIFVLLVSRVFATTRASDGSLTDVNTQIGLSSNGDTVTIPSSGSFTWGASGAFVNINKSIHLTNLGATIVMSTTGNVNSAGVISIAANNVVIDGTWVITGASNGANAVTPIVAGEFTGIRITGITYTSPSTGGYFVYVSGATGVCDHCTVHGSGQLQTFMIRGRNARWNSTNTMGTSAAWFVEDCDIDAPYAQENDGAACSVIRFNTLRNGATLDMHMIETSTSIEGTNHGSRQLEGYDNTYTTLANGYQWVRAQGGAGMIFDNVVPQQAGSGGTVHYIALIFEYGAQTGIYTPGLATIPTPAGYPIPDEIGIGPYNPTQVGGAEPMYYWNNQETDGTDNPLLGFNPQSSAAITAYGSTFYATSEDGAAYMMGRHRDYYRGIVSSSFPSVSDVGRGTKASMNASSPTLAGQAWWVTDEGSWNTKLAANTSGQLYKWNGSAWVLFYTPYQYPHPLNTGGAPVFSSASIPSAGTSMSVVYSASCTTGAGGNGGVTVTASGGAVTSTYSSGSGSTTYVYTLGRTINAGETVTTSYTQPGAGIAATSDATDVATYSGQSVANNSTQGTSSSSSKMSGKLILTGKVQIK